MGHDHNPQNSQDMNLVLSTDAKPRLKWTPQLHQRFVDAVNQLGGPEKATPKNLMRMMGIPGLTLYHLKSHLQKYRLGKNQLPEISKDIERADSTDCKESCSLNEINHLSGGKEVIDSTEEHIKENDHIISETIQMQMEVQRKLHEQIEVQRHLQLRIEAQGKYLQKVLKKAQETLSGYSSTAASVEHAKAEISQLFSLVSTSSFSEITETTTDFSLDYTGHNHNKRLTGCSVESSLTSSECSEERVTDKPKPETLELLDKPEPRSSCPRKRSKMVNFESIVEQKGGNKRSKQACKELNMGHGLIKLGLLETFDLNSQCENDGDLSPKLKPMNLDAKL